MSIAEQTVSLWTGRSARERMLLLAMGTLLGAAVLWYGVAAPLRGVADRASANLEHAAGLQNIVQSAAALDPAEDAAVEEILASAAPEELMVERHTAAPGEIIVWAKSPDSASLFAWIGSLQQRFGITVANLSVTPDNDGALEIEIVLGGGGA